MSRVQPIDKDRFDALEGHISIVATGGARVSPMGYVRDVGECLATIRARERTIRDLESSSCQEARSLRTTLRDLRLFLSRARRSLKARKYSEGLAVVESALKLERRSRE